ncbi:MAG: DNA mismatch repair endonuclease MutL [Deltaproteobacteria bacterium]|nr:DNA mismatch repair endonuclease MutL [Deltaproteobacteria bacterium]
MAIQILPPDIANLIAAGEVVERPASIVKELVENALDAEATTIDVRLEEGGKRLIEVRDDGIGMSRDDAALAIERHATSKLRTAEDLAAIRTLGFRGEALPSIAAVSDFTMTTRLRGHAADGVRVQVRIPEILIEAVGAPEGTSVRVESLFGRVPARQKFLKSERTELGYIQEVLTRLALAVPQCRFTLVHGDRTLLRCHQRGDLQQRIAEIFGGTIATQLRPVSAEGIIQLTGCCGDPVLAKPGSAQLYLYVNGRAVRDRVLTHAVQQAYRTYIAPTDQPFAVLCLAVPPELVDVNVHPAKAEVRFVNPNAVHDFLYQALRRVLSETNAFRDLRESATLPPLASRVDSPTASAYSVRPPPSPIAVHEALSLYRAHEEPQRSRNEEIFRSLGQLAQTYLLFECPDGALLIVDQHAAHERVGYEQLRASYERGAIESQPLLQPLIIDLAPAEMAALEDATTLLQRAGLDVTTFGGTSVALQAIPTLLLGGDCTALLRAIAADLCAFGHSGALDERLDHLFATMACHRQLRAGDPVGELKALGLLQQLTDGASKDRCPHGRPTWVRIPQADIEKWFQRR